MFLILFRVLNNMDMIIIPEVDIGRFRMQETGRKCLTQTFRGIKGQNLLKGLFQYLCSERASVTK